MMNERRDLSVEPSRRRKTGLIKAAFAAAGLAGLSLACASGAQAQGGPAPGVDPAQPARTSSTARTRPGGYLSAQTAPDVVLVLPPPPEHGSFAEKQDFEAFKATRALKGSARWTLAARDAVNYLGAFDCPLGLALTPSATPKTLLLLQRVGADAGLLTNLAKDHYNRPRPLVGDPSPICTEDQRSGLLKSFSYPSGHATFGWAMGMILAEAAPEKASDILARARAFGESRVVCGVHFVSDVEEGRDTGALLVARLQGEAAFRADLQAAAAELKTARAAVHAGPDPKECKIEEAAEAHTPWINSSTAK